MSMYQGKFDWSAVLQPPTDVRGYVKEIIMNCIGVHAEVGDDVERSLLSVAGERGWGVAVSAGMFGIVCACVYV